MEDNSQNKTRFVFVTILTFLPGEYAKDFAQGGERRPTSRGHS